MKTKLMYRIIKSLFLLPLVTTVIGAILLNRINELNLLACDHHNTHEQIFIFIGIILLFNIIANALTVISYYCLLHRVKNLIKYREKK